MQSHLHLSFLTFQLLGPPAGKKCIDEFKLKMTTGPRARSVEERTPDLNRYAVRKRRRVGANGIEEKDNLEDITELIREDINNTTEETFIDDLKFFIETFPDHPSTPTMKQDLQSRMLRRLGYSTPT